MDIELIKSALLWCSLINYGILVLWVLFISLAKDWFYSWQIRWFPMSREEAIRCNYLLYGAYKLAILILNVIPWIALQIAT